MLTEHLFYEVQMTFDLARRVSEPVRGHLDIAHRNAEIEAFGVHLRQLIDFFWLERPQTEDKRDAFAADYFEPGEWSEVRPDRPELLDQALRQKVGWGIAHLTYDRAWVAPAGKEWDIPALAGALAPTVVRFVDVVDHSRFTPGSVQGMKACALMFLDVLAARAGRLT